MIPFILGLLTGAGMVLIALHGMIRDARTLAGRASQVLATGERPRDERGRWVGVGR